MYFIGKIPPGVNIVVHTGWWSMSYGYCELWFHMGNELYGVRVHTKLNLFLPCTDTVIPRLSVFLSMHVYKKIVM